MWEGEEDEHDMEMYTHSPDRQRCPGLHPEHCGQQDEGGYSAPPLFSGKPPPWVRSPALGTPAQEEY